MQGWIKLHRKIRLNPVFADMNLLRLWLICLTEATHKEYDALVGRQVVKLEPGQFITGRFDLHKMFNEGLKKSDRASEYTVWRWLLTLQELEFLSIKSSNKFSIVSIVKWAEYQFTEQENEQQMSNKRAANEQQMSTNKNVKKEKNVKEEKILYFEIVSYLNEKAETQYRPTGKKIQELIRARWNEGFHLAEFQTVIDKKVSHWKGTESAMYLRPETLFGTKFESYLNQPVKSISNLSKNYSSTPKEKEVEPYFGPNG